MHRLFKVTAKYLFAFLGDCAAFIGKAT